MSKKTGIILGIALAIITLGIVSTVMYININDTANTKLQEIDGFKSKMEISLDNMNKTITQLVEVTVGEKDAFIEFQALVAESKKGQTLGGIMTQVQEKYPDFDIKGFDNLSSVIEAKRDEFSLAQVQYNDRVVQYNAFIVKKVNKIFLSDEHVKLDQFVVSSEKAKESMVTGKDEVKEIKF